MKTEPTENEDYVSNANPPMIVNNNRLAALSFCLLVALTPPGRSFY
jgi:hypothetical protein